MAVETLPFVQVNLPKGDNGSGVEAGGKARASDAAPGRFEGLMAEYSQEGVAAPQAAEPQQKGQVVFEGKAITLPQQVLDLMEGEEMPNTIDKILDALMGKAQGLLDKIADALGEKGTKKLSALLEEARTSLKSGKSGKMSGIASALEKVAKSLENLASDIEANPEAAESLEDKFASIMNGIGENAEDENETGTGDVKGADVSPKSPRTDGEVKGPNEKKKDLREPDFAEIEERGGDTGKAASLAAQAAADGGAVPIPDAARPQQGQQGEGQIEEELGLPTDQEPDPHQVAFLTNRPTPRQGQKTNPAMEPARGDAAQPQEETAATGDKRPQSVNAGERVTETSREDSSSARQGNDGNGSRENDSPGARTDDRNRVDASANNRRQPVRGADEETPTSNTNRTMPANTRTDFQSFFEGVLSSRRTGVNPAPMSLTYGTATMPERSEMLSNGVTNVVRFIRADGVQRANVVIEPPSLGRVSVELTSSTSGVEASIRVSNEQVRQLVQDQIAQLRMNLEQQGVQVTHFAVDVQQDNGGQGRDGSGQSDQRRRQGRRIGAIEEAEEPSEEFRVDLEQGLLHWVA